MQKRKNIVDSITMVFTRISSVILMLLILMMVVNVVGRKLFNAPISGAVELVEYGMLTCMALAISRTGFEDRQLSVTIIQEMMPAKVRAVFKCVCNIIAGIVFGSLIFRFIEILPESMASGRVSDVLYIPYYLVHLLLILAMILVALSFFYQAALAIYKAFVEKGADDKAKEEEK